MARDLPPRQHLNSKDRSSGRRRRCPGTSRLSSTCASLAATGIGPARSGRPISGANLKGRIPPSCPSGLPKAVGLQPGDAVPVNRHLSLLFYGDRVICLAFALPFASHRVADFRSRNRRLAHCAPHDGSCRNIVWELGGRRWSERPRSTLPGPSSSVAPNTAKPGRTPRRAVRGRLGSDGRCRVGEVVAERLPAQVRTPDSGIRFLGLWIRCAPAHAMGNAWREQSVVPGRTGEAGPPVIYLRHER